MSLKFILKVKIVVQIFGILESLGRNKNKQVMIGNWNT